MRDVAIVLGMHRSGTSSVAGALTKLGATAPRNLMNADVGNSAGYFESVRIKTFNDELLASAGSTWDDWREFNRSWYRSPVAEKFIERAIGLFEGEFAEASFPILKDPRLCRIAPFWLDVMRRADCRPRVIIPIRSPLEVAQSLKNRDGIPIAKGVLLWLRHVLDAELETRNTPRSIFTWDQFLSDWRRIAQKISAEAGVVWPRLSDRAANEIDYFLDDKLVRNRVSHAELIAQSEINRWTVASYEALLELTRNPLSNSALDTLDEVRQSFGHACTVFGAVLAKVEVDLEEERHRFSVAADVELNTIRTELNATRTDRNLVAEELRRRFDELTAARRDYDRVAEELRQRIDELDASRADRQRVLEELTLSQEEMRTIAMRMAELSDGYARIAGEREELATKLSAAEALLTEATARSDRNGATLLEKEAALDRMTNRYRNLEKHAAEQTAATMRANAAAIAESESGAAAQLFALQDQLVGAEATLGKMKLDRHRNRFFWSKLRRLAASTWGEERLLLRSGLFDSDWYRKEYPDAVKDGTVPARHYLKEGYLVGNKPNPLFDSHWYLKRYDDVRRSGVNPLVHYIRHGYREDRDPCPDFQSTFYLVAYPDVRASGVNPLTHYLRYGMAEGRLAKRPQSSIKE